MPFRKKIDWPACAAQLGAALLPQRLHPGVIAWAAKASPRQTWAVAFSGGADSLALLLLLWAHWPKRRARLTALHFNHRLRGAASDRDERFCHEVAVSLGIRWRCGRWTETNRGTSEAQARKARHDFFGAELRRLRTTVLWLGHQQDDVAETMLMRLARGSGTAGLAAPRPVQLMPQGRVHLRPLLSLKKAEIAERLKTERIPWREDASNAAGKFLRNRMRRDVVPAWQLANGDRDALAGAALSRELLEEDDTALETWLTDVDPFTKSGALNLRRLAHRPRALVRRAIHQWLALNVSEAGLSRQAFGALLDDVMRRRLTRHSLGSGGFARISKYRLTFERADRKLSN
jgi:tRNA(Ile)-lysidine synthase